MTNEAAERLRGLAATPMSRWHSADLTWFSTFNGGVDFIGGYDGEVDDRALAAYLARLLTAERRATVPALVMALSVARVPHDQALKVVAGYNAILDAEAQR